MSSADDASAANRPSDVPTNAGTTRNWAGNITFGARRLLRPGSVDEVSALVAGSDRLRVLGSGHSFSDIADTTGDLLSLAGLPPTIEVAAGPLPLGPAGSSASVRVAAGLRYGDIAPSLHAAGYALPNLGSLPHIGIAGACATGTHGSGVRVGGLATAVAALELVRPDGSRLTLRRGDPSFAGSVVSLGALGVVTHLTLDLVPTFDVAQYVYEGFALAAVCANLDEILASAYSVSVFTDWSTAQVWQKHAVAPPAPASPTVPVPAVSTTTAAPPETWFGGTLASGERHPIPALPADSCTPQLGRAGPWHERLPHFRLAFTPSSGDELQSEFFVPRSSGVDALRAVQALGERIRPVLQVSEIRTVAADDLWLSPAYGRDTLAIHFTWVKDTAAVAPVLAAVEACLAPFAARPHWGKLFGIGPSALRELYPRFADFQDLAAETDPAGKFRNAYLDRVLERVV